MTQQKSENSIVPEDLRKLVQTQASADESSRGGGKGVPVDETAHQPDLPFVTAENPRGISGSLDVDRSASELTEVPKAKVKRGKRASATIERVIEKLGKAWAKVASNKGAPGPDGKTIEHVQESLTDVLRKLKTELEEGRYEPGEILRVNIPKPDGKGVRGLGIPNVEDRVVQEAVRQVLEPLYDPEFHSSSHGFRPGRGCHTAIKEAREYVKEGYEWVVDIDLKKYFDKVNHQRLMARLSEKIGDKDLLILIGKMLEAEVIMPEGLAVKNKEGVPQGGPLSPLLSNVVLDEFDQELERRGHRFVRYADDCNIFVKSERAGKRVMASVIRFLETRMRLEVNREKSAVAAPNDRHFLGFRLKPKPIRGDVDILLSKRSRKRLATRVKELTPRNWGRSMDACIAAINEYLRGWMNHFHVCTDVGSVLGATDAHIRRRLRAIQLKQWKCRRTMARRLIKGGAPKKTAWRNVYDGRKSIWKLSLSYSAHKALSPKNFEERGLFSLKEAWRKKRKAMFAAGKQLNLPLG